MDDLNNSKLSKFSLVFLCITIFFTILAIAYSYLPYKIMFQYGYFFIMVLITLDYLIYFKLEQNWKRLFKYSIWIILACIIINVILIIKILAPFFSNYKVIQYVYACPSTNTSKCYHVRANIETDSESETGYYVEWIDKIFFENGGSVSFSYCNDDETVKNRFICEDEDDGSWWTIDLAEKQKVPR